MCLHQCVAILYLIPINTLIGNLCYKKKQRISVNYCATSNWMCICHLTIKTYWSTLASMLLQYCILFQSRDWKSLRQIEGNTPSVQDKTAIPTASNQPKYKCFLLRKNLISNHNHSLHAMRLRQMWNCPRHFAGIYFRVLSSMCICNTAMSFWQMCYTKVVRWPSHHASNAIASMPVTCCSASCCKYMSCWMRYV